jgi:hypothetical protein
MRLAVSCALAALITACAAASLPPFEPHSALRGRLTRWELREAPLISRVASGSLQGRAAGAGDDARCAREVVVHVGAFGRSEALRLERNEGLLHPEFELKLQLPTGNDFDTLRSADLHGCFYRAVHADGLVSALALHGGRVEGVFQLDGEAHVIEPAHYHVSAAHLRTLSLHTPHVVYRARDVAGYETHCGVGDGAADADGAASLGPHLLHRKAEQSAAAGAGAGAEGFRLQAVAKPVSLLIALDYNLSNTAPWNTDVYARVTAQVNLAASFYVARAFPTNVTLQLRAIYMYRYANPFPAPLPHTNPAEVNVTDYLNIWNAFRNNASSGLIQHDVGHLLSGLDFQDSLVGLAVLNVICTSSASGINEFTHTMAFDSALLAHEIGHNFGFQHDGDPNFALALPCANTSFIMSASSSVANPATAFSDCSVDFFEANFNASKTCLDDPVVFNSSICGNGIVELGEACDCHSNNCTGRDSCCNGATCQLIANATCSGVEPCCNPSTCNLRLAAENFTCRGAASADCDVAEVCNGTSAQCPPDVVRPESDTTACTSGLFSGRCFRGGCVSLDEVCSRIAPVYRECPDMNEFNARAGRTACGGILYCLNQTDGACYGLFARRPPAGTSCGCGQQCDANELCTTTLPNAVCDDDDDKIDLPGIGKVDKAIVYGVGAAIAALILFNVLCCCCRSKSKPESEPIQLGEREAR